MLAGLPLLANPSEIPVSADVAHGLRHTMKITFVLPPPSPIPIGGYKVAYEYANRLAERGHSVLLAHLREFEDPPTAWRYWTRYREEKRRSQALQEQLAWFPLSPKVKVESFPYPMFLRFRRNDAVVATSWRTAAPVAALSPINAAHKAYLLQHVEDWDGAREEVLSTWTLPLSKIVISRWLADVASSLGETSIHVPNGIAFDEFGSDTPPESRDPNRIVMLWHDLEWKGSREGLEAISRARKSHPSIRLDLFGTNEAPRDLPDWATYHRSPSRIALRALYNGAAIFVGPSHAEGWPLPPAEAMACGCACVLTDIGGHREYAVDGRNALYFPARDVEAASEAIAGLMADPQERIELARNAVEDISRFTWERATDGFLEALTRTESVQAP